MRIFYDSKARKDVSGVVGSYEATRQSFQFDTIQALSILAIISLSLAVVNLFPFLPLEGTNNKIKTMKRQAYGFRDHEFFKLKILAIHETRYELVG